MHSWVLTRAVATKEWYPDLQVSFRWLCCRCGLVKLSRKLRDLLAGHSGAISKVDYFLGRFCLFFAREVLMCWWLYGGESVFRGVIRSCKRVVGRQGTQLNDCGWNIRGAVWLRLAIWRFKLLWTRMGTLCLRFKASFVSSRRFQELIFRWVCLVLTQRDTASSSTECSPFQRK